MNEPKTNYFVCTLGQASLINKKHPHDFTTINNFIDTQASKCPNSSAVGFARPCEKGEEWYHYSFSFLELRHGSISAAIKLSNVLPKPRKTNDCVALLCPSSVEFLFAWLGLMRVGYAVLLIAPQCQPSAISHLCKSCNASVLLYDLSYESLTKSVESVNACTLPFDVSTLHLATGPPPLEEPTVSASDIAYFHHTSGTSTGLPKPIPQSHHAAVGVLPCLRADRAAAAFSTTPLYHGGIADCFRAWTSGAMIWLFPGKDLPITATNIIKSLDVARKCSSSYRVPQVKYFSSVPFVLHMLASEAKGLESLTSMNIVGVGGAALPQAAGDDLVRRGVNLVSRFGSAECGFLMSSHRDYDQDKDWQFLRSSSGSQNLRFEPRDSGLAELVVLPGWPHMAKTNREDGSFATSDLFEPHNTIPDAWRYHSRADSQLTLITGKKFDPAPIEAAISSSSTLLRDVFVFGTGEHAPGALLFASLKAKDMPEAQILEKVWPRISKANESTQSHACLSKSMMVVLPYQDEEPLEKSSKGTVLRSRAEKKYSVQIKSVYQDSDKTSIEDDHKVLDEEVPRAVSRIVQEVTGLSIPDDADLFHHGVDSVACMQIRRRLGKLTSSAQSDQLPMNVVYDCGTVDALASFLLRHRKGQTSKVQDDLQLMRDLVAKYNNFNAHIAAQASTNGEHPENGNGKVIVLTGATGALGAHLLSLLRSEPSVSRIYCLIRASSDRVAHERVTKSLQGRQLPPIDETQDHDKKIVCVPCKLSDPELGLSSSVYQKISTSATTIIHAAWAVNFTLRLRSFVQDHIAGTNHLLNLALSSQHPHGYPHFLLCSSTASVLGPGSSSPISERASSDPNTASPLGYSRSKWVAERICEEAGKQTELDVSVLRIGQLCGDTVHGVWNQSEAWPLMLSSVAVTGCLPDLSEETLGWLPVDLAAKAVVELALQKGRAREAKNDSTPVYHILNPDNTTTWQDILAWIKGSGAEFEVVSPNTWLGKLDDAKEDHPARKLLGVWKEAYGSDQNSAEEKKDMEFQMESTRQAISTMKNIQPISEKQVRLMWAWIQEEIIGKKAKSS